MNERRSASRQRSFLQGRIFFNNRRTSVDCLIRDFSETGAKLKFHGVTSTPDVVELFVPSKEETRRAKIVWRNADEVGITFILDEPAPSLAPAIPQSDLSARIEKLERDLALLQRRFNELQASLRQVRGAE